MLKNDRLIIFSNQQRDDFSPIPVPFFDLDRILKNLISV
jgi:hypothetical protein